MEITNIEIANTAKELGIELIPIQIKKIKDSVNRSRKGPSIELVKIKIEKVIKLK